MQLNSSSTLSLEEFMLCMEKLNSLKRIGKAHASREGLANDVNRGVIL